jgi:hypothetical protein
MEISVRYLIFSFSCLVSTALYAQTVSLNALEQEFKDALTGAILQGQSSRDGKEGVSPDKYDIERVEKASMDNWTFHVRLSMRGHEMTMPIPLEVKWAGDTPVITVTDKGYPGMGTYTARVLVYKGHYAGTWYGRNGGGKVWGVVTKKATAAASLPLTPGRWVGAISYGDLKVPFSLDLKLDGGAVKAAFLNGEERSEAASGSWSDGALQLDFAPRGMKLDAKLVNSELKGRYGAHDIEAAPYCTCAYEGEAGPDIGGEWKVDGGGGKLLVTRKGEDTFAVLAGSVHSGRFDGLQFALNRFDGERASVMEIVPRKDGGLDVTLKQPGEKTRLYRAVR